MEVAQPLKRRQRKPEFIRRVEKVLFDYPILKASIENERELEREGLADLFPSLTPSYEEKTSPAHSEYQSHTERYGILRASRIVQVRQTERALKTLSLDEREIIQERYFDPAQHTDTFVADQLGLSRAKYHRIKQQALKKLAIALNLL